jgi:hypothetical protein
VIVPVLTKLVKPFLNERRPEPVENITMSPLELKCKAVALHCKYAHVKFVIRVEEAFSFPNKDSFADAVALTLAFPPPKTLYWRIPFTLHLNRSRPLLNSEFRGSLEPVKSIEISMKFAVQITQQNYLSLRCMRIISQISEPLSVVI